VTITLLAPNYGSTDKDDTKLYWQQIINDFQAKYPNVKVSLQMATWDNLATKLTTAVQNNDAPDLFEGGGYADVAAQGLLYKASDIVSPQTVSNLIPHVAQLGQTKGQDGQQAQYGIPFTTSTRALFYNTALFQQAGISAARRPGPTWPPTPPRSRRWARPASACRWARRRRRPRPTCGRWATAAGTRTPRASGRSTPPPTSRPSSGSPTTWSSRA